MNDCDWDSVDIADFDKSGLPCAGSIVSDRDRLLETGFGGDLQEVKSRLERGSSSIVFRVCTSCLWVIDKFASNRVFDSRCIVAVCVVVIELVILAVGFDSVLILNS